MSCFIVGDETLDNVVALALGSDITMLCGVTLCNADGWPRDGAGTALGRELLILNNEAFRSCYQGRHAESMVDPSTYTYKGLHVNSDKFPLALLVERYKSLSCLTYQLSEDPVDKTDYYQQLEELERTTAQRIVGRMPEYEAAPWG